MRAGCSAEDDKKRGKCEPIPALRSKLPINVKEILSRTSAALTTEGRRHQQRVNQALAGMYPNCFKALIQRGALRLTESAS